MDAPTAVFIVDDDPDVRNALTRLFESVDLTCRTFSTAQEFLDAYDPGQPGCLVLDVRMPGMTGVELHRELLDRGCRIPVVVITGYADVSTAVEAMERGAVTFLEKPVRPQHLVDRVHEALRRDAEAREAARQREALMARLAELTPREHEVMDRLVNGETTKEIAAALGLSPKTVDFRRQKVLDKVNARNQAELVRLVLPILAQDRHKLRPTGSG